MIKQSSHTSLWLTLRRIAGAVLILTAVCGWLLSLVGLVWLWSQRQPSTEQALAWVGLAQDAVETTGSSLQIVEETLVQTADILGLVKSSLDAMGNALDNTTPVLDDLSQLTGQDLVKIIETSQASLYTASASAQLVDDTLRVIAGIPLIGKNYQPAVPLAVSLNQVANSLNGLPATLKEMQTGIDQSGNRLDEVKWLARGLAGQIDLVTPRIWAELSEVNQAQALALDLQLRLENLEKSLPATLNGLWLLLSTILIWWMVSQLGLFLQGLDFFLTPRLMPEHIEEAHPEQPAPSHLQEPPQ